MPLASYLAENDVVVNCVLQDTAAPWTFLTEEDLTLFRPGSLVVDVSCDEGMGFSWARPTSFEDPTFVVGDNITYYAVDHTPSYLWNSATWEISAALLPHLRTVLSGPEAWADEPTIGRAVEIQDGEIRNPAILAFQDREATYPHVRRVEARTRDEADSAHEQRLDSGLAAVSAFRADLTDEDVSHIVATEDDLYDEQGQPR